MTYLITAMMNTRHANKSIKKRLWRECKCSIHSPNDSRMHDVKTGRKCPQRFTGRLTEKGYFTAKRSFICQECLDHYGSVGHDAGSFYGVTGPPMYSMIWVLLTMQKCQSLCYHWSVLMMKQMTQIVRLILNIWQICG